MPNRPACTGSTKHVAVIGFGNIGSGIIELLLTKKHPELELRKVVVKHIDKERPIPLPKDSMTDNVDEVLNDPQIDIIVEVMGGLEPAKSILIHSLKNGKHVVTANKALIATHGKEIFREALKFGCTVGIRGTFVGCFPLLHDLSARLQEGRIRNMVAILNGTTNFILSRMTHQGLDFQKALQLAQQEGYAEPYPTDDIKGIDTAYKIRILLGLTNNSTNIPSNIQTQGITEIETQDIKYAKEFGYVFKLVGIIHKEGETAIAGVFPVLVKADSFLGSIDGANNAVEIEDDLGVAAGLIAPGAGKYPTAQAIMKDLLDIAKGIRVPIPEEEEEIILKDIAYLPSKFYLRFTVVDRPGVLAKLSQILANHNISIAAVSQKESASVESVPVVMLLHPSTEAIVLSALKEIDVLPIVKERTKVFRVFDGYFPRPTNLTS